MSDDPTTSHPTFQPVPPTSEPLPPADPVVPGRPVEPVRAAVAPPKKSSSGRWLNLLLGVAVAVAIAGVAFAVGRSTAPQEAAAFQRGTGGNFGNGGSFNFRGGSFDPNQVPAGANGGSGTGNGGQGAGRFGLGGLTINGTVQAVSADSITITTQGGQQITLSLSGDTTYHTQAPASASDVTVGSTVAVQVDGLGGFRGNNGNGNNGNGNNGNGNNGNNGGAGNGTPTLRGTVSSVTVIPQ